MTDGTNDGREPGLGDRRGEYERAALTEAEVGADPIALFDRWFRDATDALPAPPYAANVMTVATVDADGAPDARVVLLKGFGADGVDFYTNYESAKGRQLAARPVAALVLHWLPLERQVRVRGRVERLPRAASEAYFATRPRGSQVGAWASPQSAPIAPDALAARVAEAAARFGDGPIPCPPHWGGYRVVPERIEFWQGRRDRLHDRIRFVRDGAGWRRERLAP